VNDIDHQGRYITWLAMTDDAWQTLTPHRSSVDGRDSERTAIPERLRRMVADLVLETTPEGIWLIDAQARTTFVNRRLADLLGYTQEEMIGKDVFTFMDRARWPVAERNLKQREMGIEDRHELELLRKDGTRVWVLGSANPVFDRNGEYAGALGVLGDLTKQKDAEYLLQSQVDALGARLLAQPPQRRNEPTVVPSSTVEDPDRFREPFRTAIVLATYGTLFATVAVLTVGGVVGALFGQKSPTGDPDL
jgi:PAS domain S-box-containing protein